MKFKMLHYEVRYFDKTEWEKISEVEVLESLQDAFVRITPALRDMIQGKQVTTPDAKYRIKGLG
jgi:hypothetical protein